MTGRAGGNPFPGYRPFDAGDAGTFFGREQETDALEARLARAGILAVVGAPEVGKSSLVRAGIVPRLRQRHWRVAILRPGEDPIGNLARALSAPEALGQPADEIEPLLRAGPGGLDEAARAAGLSSDQPLVVVVDQLDELATYRHCREALGTATDDELFAAVLQSAEGGSGGARVLTTMRLGVLDGEPGWHGLAHDAFVLEPMTVAQLRRAISAPAEAAGAGAAAELVETVVAALDSAPAAVQLPLVQHALMRAWDVRTQPDEVLALRHLDAVGGIDGALFRHADEVCAADPMPDLVDQVVRAATGYVDGRFVPRPGLLGGIASLCDASVEDVSGVVTRLQAPGRTFLKASSTNGTGPTTVVDVSYDSFAWLRRRRWSYLAIPVPVSSGDAAVRAGPRELLEATVRSSWPWAAATLLVGSVALSLALSGSPRLAVLPPAVLLALAMAFNWPFVRRYYWPLLLSLATALVLIAIFPWGGPGPTPPPDTPVPSETARAVTFSCGPGLVLAGTSGPQDCVPIPVSVDSTLRCGAGEILVGAPGGTVDCARVPACAPDQMPGIRMMNDRVALVCQPLVAGPAGRDGVDGEDGVDGLPGSNGTDGLPGEAGRSVLVPTCDGPGQRLVGNAAGELECRPLDLSCAPGEVLTGVAAGRPICQPFPLAPTIQFGELPTARPGFEYRLNDGSNVIDELGVEVTIRDGRVSVTDRRTGTAILRPTPITSEAISFPEPPLPPGVFGYTLTMARESGVWRVVIRRCAGECRG